jgi:Domain of unknown function (DUF4416)
VKLFVGMLSPDPALFNVCAEILCEKYGIIDYQSDVLPWDKTDYYREEMGDGIARKIVFFERLLDPTELPKIKLYTNEIENDFALRTGDILRRRINLDPGYMTEAKVVLATTKDFSHRIYIGSNIYAEVTLRYSIQNRGFTPCDYTYPDYRTDQYRTVFNKARELLRAELHHAYESHYREL